MRRGLLLTAVLLSATVAFGFDPVPPESGRALGVTKGKPFSSGFVFVNGKYLPPPYVVERWGVGLRINGQFVSGPVIEWSEFLKTQDGVKVTRSEAPAAAETPAPVAAETPAPLPTTPDNEDLLNALDDLFDDNPGAKKAKKPTRKTTASAAPARPRTPPKPKVTVTYALEGDFVPNARSKALVARINAARSEIDRTLRLGGFFFFGDGYARVTGDARTAEKLLRNLPEALQRCSSAADLATAARAAGCVYLTDGICADLYAHRVSYRALQERRAREDSARELDVLLKGP